MIRGFSLSADVLEEHKKKHHFDKLTVVWALPLLAKQNAQLIQAGS